MCAFKFLSNQYIKFLSNQYIMFCFVDWNITHTWTIACACMHKHTHHNTLWIHVLDCTSGLLSMKLTFLAGLVRSEPHTHLYVWILARRAASTDFCWIWQTKCQPICLKSMHGDLFVRALILQITHLSRMRSCSQAYMARGTLLIPAPANLH